MISEQGGETVSAEDILLEDKRAIAPDGRFVTLYDLAHDALHKVDQEQIMGVGSYVSPSSPPPGGGRVPRLIPGPAVRASAAS